MDLLPLQRNVTVCQKHVLRFRSHDEDDDDDEGEEVICDDDD
jgi:hypothetical protein